MFKHSVIVCIRLKIICYLAYVVCLTNNKCNKILFNNKTYYVIGKSFVFAMSIKDVYVQLYVFLCKFHHIDQDQGNCWSTVSGIRDRHQGNKHHLLSGHNCIYQIMYESIRQEAPILNPNMSIAIKIVDSRVISIDVISYDMSTSEN